MPAAIINNNNENQVPISHSAITSRKTYLERFTKYPLQTSKSKSLRYAAESAPVLSGQSITLKEASDTCLLNSLTQGLHGARFY